MDDEERLATKITEADVEAAGDREAGRHRAIIVKGAFRRRRGWPDKFYLFPRARILFVEYKRPGEEAEKDQQGVHRKLRARGFQVCVIDDPGEAQAAVRLFALGRIVDPEAEGAEEVDTEVLHGKSRERLP